jgi:L-threonylcarbamoyladenylate synthase
MGVSIRARRNGYDEQVLNTLRLNAERRADVERAATLLRAGGTVAFPTETVYGLGANALDSAAVEGIFAAKKRPAWDPLIVHVAGPGGIEALTELPRELAVRVEALAAAFWPGPLTLLLPRSARVPDAVTAGRGLVGVRVPAHPVALELLRLADVPLAAPSANIFGHTSPTTAAHVLADLDGRIDAVLDGGATRVGLESTVLDPARMVVYRPGAVTLEQIEAVCGERATLYVAPETTGAREAMPSPGVGIRHYAPRAEVVLVEGTRGTLAEAVREAGGGVGVMLPDGWGVAEECGAEVFAWGAWERPEQLAARLFAGLRELDERGVARIVVPMPAETGLGSAICDRLRKAARKA